MKKIIFKYEGEEKEISLSTVKDLKSTDSINHVQTPNKRPKVKFENSNNSSLSMKKSQKTFEEKSSQKKEDVQPEFERRKKKFKTLLPVKSNALENNIFKKKKRKKKRGKTAKVNFLKKKTLISQKTKTIKSEEEEDNMEDIEEFDDKEIKTKLEVVLEKKFEPTQTMLSYCKCQLFISYDNMTGFEYTGLEGILCIMINRILSNLYIQIYDIMDFKKQFEIELYTNILLNRGYEIMSPKFHTIEFPTFCLGINFYTVKKANEIKNIILNYSKALNSSLFYQYEKKNHDTFKQKKLFDYISDPKKVISSTDKRKKAFKEMNYQLEYYNNNNNNNNANNENESIYFEQMFGTYNKKLNYKISSNEQMLSFSIDQEANEVTFDTSKGANRFLEQNNIEISDINEEYEKMKEKVKSKMKNNKFVTNKTKKSIQEEIKDKENKEKIIEIINQIEGLQVKDKNIINFEDEKEKLNNKIKKFNVTKRLPLNQTLQINSGPENLVFYGEDSDSEGEGDVEEEEEIEEGEEEDDDENENENGNNDENIMKNLMEKEQDINSSLNLKDNNIEDKIESDNKKSMKLHLSGIIKNVTNSSDVSYNSLKNHENNKNIPNIEFSSKNSSKKSNEKNSIKSSIKSKEIKSKRNSINNNSNDN